ncbi:unnamed protein product [Hyaloperonospora brassicae]|uniref:DEK-C domain-containing protein n=1 Tax=Hyaloperonospora brassicae TaxID=162125 RepID=A0AAV0UBA7_HYABA|nr:unnamed protein product [Hyaloperonospora brassicae]
MADTALELETTQDVDAQAAGSNQRVETAPSPSPDLSAPIATSLSGRVRKTAQLFTFAQVKSDEADAFTPPVGKGVKVRDVEFIKHNVEALGKQQHEMIRQLYSIMFGRRFQQKNVKAIKEHILEFSGIVEQDEKSRENLVAKMGKWKMTFVHDVMNLLAVDRSKKSFDEEGKVPNKEALLDRLVDWLYNPQKTKLAEKKATILARKVKQRANKRAKAAKKKASESVKKKRKTTKKTAVAVEETDDADHVEATESEGEESCSDFEEKKEKKKTVKKQKVTSRTTKSRIIESGDEDDVSEKGLDGPAEKKEKQSAVTKWKKQPATKAEDAAKAVDKGESESEVETLDSGVRSKIRDIIARGNAEELTLKKILRQLSADLGRDMTAQKNAIKQFITSDRAET